MKAYRDERIEGTYRHSCLEDTKNKFFIPPKRNEDLRILRLIAIYIPAEFTSAINTPTAGGMVRSDMMPCISPPLFSLML